MGEPSQERCVANVRNFSITTSRENIDTTCLNQHFRNNYENGLIAGQGTLNCLWSYEADCADAIDTDEIEFAEYLARLCIRVVQGASFEGFFYLYYGGNGTFAEDSTWYQCDDCIITNVAVSVEPPADYSGDPIRHIRPDCSPSRSPARLSTKKNQTGSI